MSMPAMSNSNAGCKPVKLAFKAEIEISAFFWLQPGYYCVS